MACTEKSGKPQNANQASRAKTHDTTTRKRKVRKSRKSRKSRKARKAPADLGVNALNSMYLDDETSKTKMTTTDADQDVAMMNNNDEGSNTTTSRSRRNKKPIEENLEGSGPPRPDELSKPGFTAKLTKRGKRQLANNKENEETMKGAGLYSNGTYLVFRPPQMHREFHESEIIDIVADSLLGGLMPKAVGVIRKNIWTARFNSIDEAKASIGRTIKFGLQHGCNPPQDVPLEPYLTSGPTVFICDRPGPISNDEAQHLITNADILKEIRFWYGAITCMGVEGSMRVLIFETSPEVMTMNFIGSNGYEMRFRPKQHSTLECEFLVGIAVPANMPMRLIYPPNHSVSIVSNMYIES
ncbi:hypothetical protein E4U13_004702 [Claviceps humidiphila]|uniref:Uncharacterized protein n=1 Tax=Claviceps humidiphila TaxID=1294629 RepID=A0A9P7PX27_9HYPO|nr:hypothetical protein E4U13_004702 [Claviceps humidiphila]